MEKQTSLTITSKNCLTTYTPKQIAIQYKGVVTVEQALNCGSESLAKLINLYDEKKVAALLKLQLVELNEILNLKRPLSEKAIEMIAEEILSTYKALTMADVYLIFKRVRNGYYGELYESINMPKVMRWFSDYFDERCDVAERRSQQEAGQYRGYGGQRVCQSRSLTAIIREQREKEQ
ncbi:hypothetical protein LJC16_02210 [Bacteroidales bacterium OttesenSCG-928-C19]|nr:hypothetical protein [Bacteroidales bacterium OttesenSCG-928-C19]